MKSQSKSSCLGTSLLLVVILVVIRYLLPSVWKILAGLFTGALYLGIGLFLIALLVLGYFTYKNFGKNKQKQEQSRYARVTRVEDLYNSLVKRLTTEMTLNQISAEELLQSEILIKEHLGTIREELIRLKEFASPGSQKDLSAQLREYQQRLSESRDTSGREILQQNIKMIEEKRERMEAALEEIRQKEGLVDWVFNSLVKVEEDVKFGRPVQHLFPADLYRRFGLPVPSEQSLPPLSERSNE